ncbi:XRE family transcriptional regulator [Nitrospira defluvii]|nr:XRE family transcriptional regulator [Nitrospira defluvii]
MPDTTKKVRTLSDGTKIIQTEHPFVGLPDADERLAKVKIASEINRLLKKKGLKQKEAAKLLSITQPEISMLNRGRLSGFTFDRLYRFLNALNVDVEITIKKHPAHSKGPAGVHILPV